MLSQQTLNAAAVGASEEASAPLAHEALSKYPAGERHFSAFLNHLTAFQIPHWAFQHPLWAFQKPLWTFKSANYNGNCVIGVQMSPRSFSLSYFDVILDFFGLWMLFTFVVLYIIYDVLVIYFVLSFLLHKEEYHLEW